MIPFLWNSRTDQKNPWWQKADHWFPRARGYRFDNKRA